MRVKKVEVYVITDPRAYEPDCGHFDSVESAYNDLASTLIYNKENRTGKYIDFNNKEELEKAIRLETRLTKYLMWLDSRK
jgi:hypothetical protein